MLISPVIMLIYDACRMSRVRGEFQRGKQNNRIFFVMPLSAWKFILLFAIEAGIGRHE